VAREFDKNSPDCGRYKIGVYRYYGARAVCQPYIDASAFE
jgi:hypothetical protein